MANSFLFAKTYFPFFTFLPDYCKTDKNKWLTMTPNQIRVTLLCHGVTKILTLHRMSKMDFEPDFRNPQMHSFPNMCNTMGSKMDGLAVREHFLSKNAEKTAF